MLDIIVGIIGTGVIGALAWIFSLGNRVSVVETKQSGSETLMKTQFESLNTLLNSKFAAMDSRLERIERSMNGHLERDQPMSSVSDIIDSVIEREGGFSNDPLDKGGRTDKGISEKSNPEAWADGKVDNDEAREIYFKKYVVGPGFYKVTNVKLQHQLVDFGVNSGPMIAIKALQRAVGAEQDGILGPDTLSKISPSTGNALASERIKLLGRIVTKNPSQLRFLNGWLSRALEFVS